MTEIISPIPSRLKNVAIGGHVAGADQIIDDETGLTLDKVAGGALEEKEYTSGSNNGMGRVVLRKNLVEGVNTLTRSMMQASNTIYVIQYDFTLGEDITVPANSVLNFEGGSIRGARTLTGVNTSIQAGTYKIFSTDVIFAGTWKPTAIFPEWFGAKGDGIIDDTLSIQAAFDFGFSIKSNISLVNNYYITNTLHITRTSEERGFIEINGGGKIIAATGVTIIKATNATTSDVSIKNIKFSGDGVAIDMENGKIIRLWADRCTFDGFVHAFYSSDLVQDLHISNCLFFHHTNYIIQGTHFYTTTIEYCIAELGNYAFFKGNRCKLTGNTLENFTSSTEPVVYCQNGSIIAINNYIEYNKCNFITFYGEDLYGGIITGTTQQYEQNNEAVIKIASPTARVHIGFQIYNNIFLKPAFENNSKVPIIAYNNITSGNGLSYDPTASGLNSTNLIQLTPYKKIYSSKVAVPGNSVIDVCYIEPKNNFIPPLIKVTSVTSVVNVGAAYIEAVYHGTREVSKTGDSHATDLLNFIDKKIQLSNASSSTATFHIIVEIYGDVYFNILS